jgi:phospholipid N-methyltransferase
MVTTQIGEIRLFWSEFRRNFRTTGAALPSSRWLGRALARYVPSDGSSETVPPRRVLEVGPGTGAVTRQVVSALGDEDRLDLVELNDEFVTHLKRLLEQDPYFAAVADRVQIFHQGVESLSADEPYDAIVSGLPLNNFPVPLVETLLGSLQSLLRPGGTLSFFEYIAIRDAKRVVAFREERDRLRGISAVLEPMFASHEFRREWIWANVPPAWVHHLRFS